MSTPSPIKRAMYLSWATRPMTRGELEDLLAGARVRNAARGITGILIYDAGRFAQVLEGHPALVDGLLANIRKDPRHQQYLELSSGMVDTRYFEGWSMDWANLESYELAEPKALKQFLSQRHITDRDAVYRALMLFIEGHSRRTADRS